MVLTFFLRLRNESSIYMGCSISFAFRYFPVYSWRYNVSFRSWVLLVVTVVTYLKKSQCEISSLRSLSILTGRELRKALEIAAFISLVKSNTPGTANENDTHFPAKRWRLFAETTERAKICWIRFWNFSFFSGIRLIPLERNLTGNPNMVQLYRAWAQTLEGPKNIPI